MLFVVALAGCAARATGPAWPKPHDTGEDGGQSLAPRAGAVSVEADKPDETPVAPEAAPAAPSAPASEPAGGGPAITPSIHQPEEPIQTEDIIIEIDD